MAVHGYVDDPLFYMDPLGLSTCAKSVPRLSDDIAKNFLGGKYSGRVLDEDLILYRVGDASQPLGQWFTKSPAGGILQSRIDQAILPKWPGSGTSPINTAFKIKIPKGTTIYTGKVAPQGGFYLGGTQQIFISKPWTIKGVDVLGSWGLK